MTGGHYHHDLVHLMLTVAHFSACSKRSKWGKHLKYHLSSLVSMSCAHARKPYEIKCFCSYGSNSKAKNLVNQGS